MGTWKQGSIGNPTAGQQSPRSPGRGLGPILSQSLGRTHPGLALTWGFWSPGLRDRTFLLLQPALSVVDAWQPEETAAPADCVRLRVLYLVVAPMLTLSVK